MIIFNELTEDRKGIRFSSTFKEKRNIKIKVLDSYTGLFAWSDLMEVSPGGGYFFSYPVSSRYMTFEIIDPETLESFLKVNLFYQDLPSIEDLDKYKKLSNYKYKEKDQDLWAAYPLYDIFINKCYKKEQCSVAPGDVVFDIGSNLGFFTYHAICEGAKEVYSFEPGISQFNSIKENFGSLDSLHLENLAVSDFEGEINFYVHPSLSVLSSTSIEGMDHSLDGYIPSRCKSINLYEYCLKNNIGKIDYLKMDCEGAEYKIIESLPEEFLKNSISKVCLEYHDNKDMKVYKIIDKLIRCGFFLNLDDVKDSQEVGILYAWK